MGTSSDLLPLLTPPLADVHPALGVRVVCGPVELRGTTDDLLARLCALAADGVHAPGAMPFLVPWTDTTPAERARRTAQWQWRCRAEFSPERWDLNLAVLRDGVVVGMQGLSGRDFLVTRSLSTGSWLGLEHQGRGTGTLMRQAVAVLAVDHLGAEELRSAAFADNPASHGVSRKVGYRPDGTERVQRRPGELAVDHRLRLDPADLVRPAWPVEVHGVEALRREIGLDA
jgi:RimJ/RimL family protein N-acetyltransferase